MRPLLRNVLGPGIEKRFDLDDDELPVMADPTQLEVAVLNLAINARDAMPDGGVLTFATRRGRRSTDDPELDDGDYVELSIADTGVGHDATRSRRARSSPSSPPRRSARAPGSACRWSMAWRASRAAARGSTASPATAPRSSCCSASPTRAPCRGRRARPRPRAPRNGRAADASVLVIDDDPDVRDFIVASLEEQGYRGARGERRRARA